MTDLDRLRTHARTIVEGEGQEMREHMKKAVAELLTGPSLDMMAAAIMIDLRHAAKSKVDAEIDIELAEVEIVARAIWGAHEARNPIKFTRQRWEQGTETARSHRLHDARVAIQALAAIRNYKEARVDD